MQKYYVKFGLAGYGPDLDEMDEPTSLEDVAYIINQDLNDAANSAEEFANALGESEEYERAWKTHKLAEELDILARNFDPNRSQAPLYAGRPALWLDSVQEMIDANFPVDVSENTRLYVWEAEEDEYNVGAIQDQTDVELRNLGEE